jgi:putative membrane protein
VRVVPYYRIQNVIDSRSVFQRRWNVATVVADTAGTSSLTGSDAAAVDFDVEEAVGLQAELGDRLQEALRDRRSEGASFEWVEDDREADEDSANAERGDHTTVGGDDDDATVETDDDGVTAEGDDDAANADDDADPEIPDEGVVRPDFSGSDRDYSEPAERVDTGEYAVDRFPSDADVAHRPDREDATDDDDEVGEDHDAGETAGDDDPIR